MNQPRATIDLETLSILPGGVIVSLGAAKFDHEKIVDIFYAPIKRTSCIAMGMTIDNDTREWWKSDKVSDEARFELDSPEAKPISYVLRSFALWINDSTSIDNRKSYISDSEVYGNDPSFDNAQLRVAYHLCGLEAPWHYRNNRCLRTMAAEYPEVQKVPSKIPHHAREDAIAEAQWLIKMFQFKTTRAAGCGRVLTLAVC